MDPVAQLVELEKKLMSEIAAMEWEIGMSLDLIKRHADLGKQSMEDPERPLEWIAKLSWQSSDIADLVTRYKHFRETLQLLQKMKPTEGSTEPSTRRTKV